MGNKKSWTVDLGGRDYAVELNANPFGKQTFTVDGQTIALPKPSWWSFLDPDRDLPVEVGAFSGTVHFRNKGMRINHDLSIDGRSVTTGEAVAPAIPMPKWAIPFALACLLIPVLSLGGALPFMLGFGGASGCMAISKDAQKKPMTRKILCLGVTAFCWLLMIVLAVVVQAAAG